MVRFFSPIILMWTSWNVALFHCLQIVWSVDNYVNIRFYLLTHLYLSLSIALVLVGVGECWKGLSNIKLSADHTKLCSGFGWQHFWFVFQVVWNHFKKKNLTLQCPAYPEERANCNINCSLASMTFCCTLLDEFVTEIKGSLGCVSERQSPRYDVHCFLFSLETEYLYPFIKIENYFWFQK